MSDIIYSTYEKRCARAALMIEIVEPVWAKGPFCLVQETADRPKDARWAWEDGILEWDNTRRGFRAIKGTELVPVELFTEWCIDRLADEIWTHKAMPLWTYGGNENA